MTYEEDKLYKVETVVQDCRILHGDDHNNMAFLIKHIMDSGFDWDSVEGIIRHALLMPEFDMLAHVWTGRSKGGHPVKLYTAYSMDTDKGYPFVGDSWYGSQKIWCLSRWNHEGHVEGYMKGDSGRHNLVAKENLR